LSSGLERKAERLRQLIEKIVMETNKGTIVVVEGQNDVRALRQLTFEGKIISTKTHGRNFLSVISEIENQATIHGIIVLLDFDRSGIEWTKRLQKYLEEKRIKVNTNYWKELRGLVGHDIKDIEGLPTYLKTLKKEIGNHKFQI
jgi:5S rRNA maturation endonuclease (ribonuclease M5)